MIRSSSTRCGAGDAVRFVDEFRDAELGQVLAGEILATVEPGRHYKLMEVCGGHTHSIYKYGVDDLLPANVELVHGPGCPVCVIPMGRVDDGIALANEPGVIFTCFGDMMRVPGLARARCSRPRPSGADVRMVYSPLDALRIARSNPDREVVFFAIGFETTAPSTALTLKRAKAEGLTQLQLHVQPRDDRAAAARAAGLARPAPRRLHRPRPRRAPSSARGRSSSSRATYGKPVVIAGFEPLDILQAIQMILVQLREGRCEVENQYKRVVPYDGNQRALEVMAEVFALRPHFEWRGLGFISHSGPEAHRRLRRLRRRAALQRPRHPRRRPQGLPVRRGAQGRHQAVRVQGVRHRVHAGAADRHVHGQLRGRLRRLLQLRPLRQGAGSGVRCPRRLRTASSESWGSSRPPGPSARSSATSASRWPTAPAARPRAASSKGCSRPRSGSRRSTTRRPSATLALTTDAFVVKPLRFPGGSIGELAVNGTVNDLAMGGAKPLALTLSLILEEGLGRDDAARRGRRDRARRARRAGVRIVGGDTKVVERGHADGMYITTTGLGRRDPRARVRARRGPATGSCSPARSARTARRSCSRAASSSSTPTSTPTRARCGPRSTRSSGRASALLRDATRGGVASVLNELARASGVAMLSQEAAVPVAPAVAGACELLGIDPMYVANEGVFVAIVAPGPSARALRRRLRPDIGEVKTEPPGMVLVATSFGGKRVMDELVGDPLPRIC